MTVLNCPVGPVEWAANDVEPTEAMLQWPVDVSCCTQIDLTAAENLRFVAAAVDLLWRKSGRRFGLCEAVIRPCERPCSCRPRCFGECQWQRLDLFNLVNNRIESVTSVTVDGADVPAAGNWYVSNENHYLTPVRDGLLWCWPEQDMNLEAGEAGTWSVEIVVGEQPPESGPIAAAELACQIARACAGEECDVPRNAVSVSRDGVTIQLETSMLKLPLVAMFLDVYGTRAPRSRIIDPAEWTEPAVV